MKDLARLGVDLATELGAQYADVRVVDRLVEEVTTKNGKVEALSQNSSAGFGVRILMDGAWGFAGSALLERDEVERVAELAVRIARASARVPGEPVKLSPVEPVTDTWSSQFKVDPFEVPLEDKISLLLDCDRAIRQRPEIRVAECEIQSYRYHKWFASSEGSEIEQSLTECGAHLQATAVDGEEVQRRSYPSGLGGCHEAAGFEVVREDDLLAGAETISREAIELLKAEQCPPGELPIIIDGSHMALQIHESCGHPIELDRVFGTEASYAGTSFLTPEKYRNFRYGSDIVNLTADATIPGGLGTFGWDDEGVPSQRVPIVRSGQFVGYLTSRETAQQLREIVGPSAPESSGGAMRADGWNRIPIIRMTNVSLEPGEWEFDDLIADTDDGIYMELNRSWSIDDKRLNFQFGTEIAYEIKNGKMGQMLKNATYTGITPQFWGSCDAICNTNHWRVWGTPNCGKGQPGQTAHTGHGAAPARFRNIQIGVMK